jgi:hypothetical protein
VTTPTSSLRVVTGATNASPIIVSWTGPTGSVSVGSVVTIAGVRGNDAANGTFTLTSVSGGVGGGTFQLDGTTGSGAYAGGGGIWIHGGEVTSAELTALDAKLAVRVTDKTGDEIRGQYTVAVAAPVSLDFTGAQSGIVANAPGARVQTAGAGRVYLRDGDEVQCNPHRTRTITVSCVEAFVDYYDAGGTEALIAFAAAKCGVASTKVSAQQPFWLPMTRVHDGARLVKASLFFFPRASDSTQIALPSAYPTLELFRIDPSSQTASQSLSTLGAATFAGVDTAAEYALAPGVGAVGNLAFDVAVGGTKVAVNAGQLLVDASDNEFAVTTSGTYGRGDPLPVQATPPDLGNFLGAATNHAPGDALAWKGTAPAGAAASLLVAAGGLVGGLDAGYAHRVDFVPSASRATIDCSTYAYSCKFTDDTTVETSLGWYPTIFVAVRLEFDSIASMRAV